MDLSAPEVFV